MGVMLPRLSLLIVFRGLPWAQALSGSSALTAAIESLIASLLGLNKLAVFVTVAASDEASSASTNATVDIFAPAAKLAGLAAELESETISPAFMQALAAQAAAATGVPASAISASVAPAVLVTPAALTLAAIPTCGLDPAGSATATDRATSFAAGFGACLALVLAISLRCRSLSLAAARNRVVPAAAVPLQQRGAQLGNGFFDTGGKTAGHEQNSAPGSETLDNLAQSAVLHTPQRVMHQAVSSSAPPPAPSPQSGNVLEDVEDEPSVRPQQAVQAAPEEATRPAATATTVVMVPVQQQRRRAATVTGGAAAVLQRQRGLQSSNN